ncbi:Ferric reductase, NAD binding protein [Metarhizium album ARSEF 1941]|uniref:Ferric reductase, NAD binding protein n=1 Tax=Metarhizium album (strain ARSEF 1941) TaxID=1081103 RepID=A0A0B2X3S7_METAS|nr:Ferric reductase, NAD binding protein [Metarhizium album ARSEF 1941]KHO01004.1 Ferric reductase, NAD binding protein [Metarhizium album ARSEF 1941]
MAWPYGFPSLTDEEKLLRRQTLDLYACIAHYSALAPALVFLAYRLLKRVASQVQSASGSSSEGQGPRYSAVPNSPTIKAQLQSPAGRFASQCRKAAWWLGHDVCFAGSRWGQRDEWLVGAVWTAWLLVLSVRGTGNDYFHLTKRFGAVAVSQLPIQYLLALKALNPVASIFASSHEHINRYHRLLGRIIYGLVCLHLLLYSSYFVSQGIWLRRMLDLVVSCGLVASFAYHGLAATALRKAREYSYRLFFITHLAVALLTPVLLFFHASSARLYIAEALAIFALDLAARRITTISAPSTVELIPGTTLVKVTSSIPAHKLARFRVAPGSHIYLSVPPQARTAAVPSSKSAIFDYLCNPFSVAAVDAQDGTICLVARVRNGPMTNLLSAFSSATSAPQPPSDARNITLGIEGPYGTMATRYNDLVNWGATKVLLVSGGVGATFTLPIYQALQSELPSAKTQFVWAIRSAGDATWAVSNETTGQGLLQDPNVQIYLTGDMGLGEDGPAAPAGSVEMSSLHRTNGQLTANHNKKRPNIEKIVDDTFRGSSDESVAVLVCGPVEMARELQQRVGPWVMKGRRVWWHNETFGW